VNDEDRAYLSVLLLILMLFMFAMTLVHP